MKNLCAKILVPLLLIITGCELTESRSKEQVFENWLEFRDEVDKRKKTIQEAETAYKAFLQAWNENVLDEMKVDIPEHLQKDPLKRVEQWIKKRIEMEQSVTYEGMIDEIESLNDEIARMQLYVEELKSESGFSEPYVVQKGDTHYELALRFLSEKHDVLPEKVGELISPVLLWDHLLEGFYAYFLYDGNNFYASISQGIAGMTPNEYKNLLDSKQQEEINQLVHLYENERSKSTKTGERISELEVKLYDKAEYIEGLEIELKQKSESLTKLDEIHESSMKNLYTTQMKADSLERAAYSVFYEIVYLDELIDKGLYHRGFLGIGAKIRSSAFEHISTIKSIDLRETNIINLGYSFHGEKVVLFSDSGRKLKNGIDYAFRGNRTISLKRPMQVGQERILIVVT